MAQKENKSKLETNADQNGVIQPLLTDLYQITMTYAYWKSGKRNDTSVFDLYFRRNPFQGEFTLFAGLEECLKYLKNFHYSPTDISYLKRVLPPTTESAFFEYLENLTTNEVTVYAIDEGSVVFPKVPLLRLEGPLPVVQLLETTLLNLVNYASLVATNAARFRMAAGADKMLLEFGLRRAQGPDGGLSASRYCYIGGFDGTSNVLAGKLFGIPVKGTHAHAFVNSFSSLKEIKNRLYVYVHACTGSLRGLEFMEEPGISIIKFPGIGKTREESFGLISIFFNKKNRLLVMAASNGNSSVKLQKCGGEDSIDFVERCEKWLHKVTSVLDVLECETKEAEFAAFISYALAFPSGFLALVDTYDVIRSGLPNFCAVAMGLNDLDYKAAGIRLDSGDLAYLSVVVKEAFRKIADKFDVPWFAKLSIVASNDINEDTIHSLNQQQVILDKGAPQGHNIDSFGIGTHLVTCQKQPALGCVFKLVEVNGEARIKLSEDVEKVTMPGKKEAFRLYGHDGNALVDILQLPNENPPLQSKRMLCRHPFQESKRAYVSPARVEPLYKCYWKDGQICQPLPSLKEIRDRAHASLGRVRTDHKRALNPTPYKVSVSDNLYNFIHNLWLENAPIGELS